MCDQPMFKAAKTLLCALLCLCLAAGSVLLPSFSLAESTGTTNAKVILRKSSDKDSKALQTLPEGEEVTILKSSGSWYRVRYGKYTGYIMKKYVDKASASSGTASRIKALGSAPGIMRVGDENSDVKKLQQALDILGYYNGSIDGKYGSGTTKAVKSYQEDHDLQADGYAGERTVKSIFGSCSSKSLTTQKAPGSSSSKKTYKTEVLDWYKDGVTRVIPKNARFTVKDVGTGKTFEMVRWSGGDHMDAEPRTEKDTKILKDIYGGSWSWRRRPILIKYNGHVYAASMNGMPHGTTTISNDFDGHICIHFKNSKTHGSDKVDSAHQNAVEKASRATW